MDISRKARVVLLASIAGVALALSFLSVHYHSGALVVLAAILAFGVGLICTNLWPDWPRPIRHLGPVVMIPTFVLSVRRSWMRKESFSEI